MYQIGMISTKYVILAGTFPEIKKKWMVGIPL
jgi:hypothetical protein